MAFTLRAPAKINLYLKVLSKRPDGYHNILSLMQMIGIYDTLDFQEEGADIQLEVKNGTVPSDGSNLVLRAARMLQKRIESTHQITRGVRITLEKKIPVSAGLGGGSSDAAATLVGLNRLWSLNLSHRALSELGGYVGSDVPFFFYGPTAWISGKGERVQKNCSDIGGWIVLVYSGNPVSTASVYHHIGEEIDLTKRQETLNMDRSVRPALDDLLVHPENDLEKVTLKAQPQLLELKRQLTGLGGKGTLMSGSGPTIFARFDRKDQAEAAAAILRTRGYASVFVAPLLKRAPVGFGKGWKRSGETPRFSDSI